MGISAFQYRVWGGTSVLTARKSCMTYKTSFCCDCTASGVVAYSQTLGDASGAIALGRAGSPACRRKWTRGAVDPIEVAVSWTRSAHQIAATVFSVEARGAGEA